MNENNNREENGFEAYIEREFIDNTEEFELPAERKKSFRIAMFYAFALVMVLIVFGVTGTYAFYNVKYENSSTTSALNASAACFDVNLSETQAYDLQYKYPITDEFALNENNITPLIVTVTNSCATGGAIPYKLYLTTYPDGGNGYMNNERVSMQVKKGNEIMNDFNSVKLNSKVAAESVPDVLKNAVGGKESTLKEGKYILIDSDTVSYNAPKTYSFKFWVNYGTVAETSVSGDFRALVSAVIN